MNKKIEEYKNRFNRIVKTFEWVGILLFLLGILISIVYYTIYKSKSMEDKQKLANENYSIDLEDDTIIYENNFNINFSINNFEAGKNYKIIIKIDNETIAEKDSAEEKNKFYIELTEEGKKIINIIVYINNKEELNITKNIYYIEPYSRNFLDELSTRGIATHYRDGSWEDYTKDIELLKMCGMQYIRTDFLWRSIDTGNGTYNYTNYDKWIDKANELNIKIIPILVPNGIISGSDMKINSEDELERFLKFAENLARRYPKVVEYEVYNEPNVATKYIGGSAYTSEEYLQWYKNAVEGLKKRLSSVNKNINIISGATATPATTTDSYMESTEFINKISNLGAYNYTDAFSYHPYDNANGAIQNINFYNKIKSHNKLFKQLGGFIKTYITEYGIYISNGITEDIQSNKLLQQSVILDSYGMEMSIIYNFWNTGTDSNNTENNYGLLNYNYTPKLSYYAIKNYCQNTNGSEYIGNLDIQSGLETHVYNKDGKPLIIAWSDNTNNTYDFPLKNLTAKDLYGKEIPPDENGNIQITTSPVYLYNADYNTFYQAISNVATTKYDEFTEKFSEQISKVPGLQASIQKSKKSIQDISKNSTLSETTAINMMKEHYNLGTTILQAYKSGTLQIEDVKVSSMLDMLDDIGGSFEDLVTVSAKTRNSNLTETQNLIATAEKLIKDNEDIEIIYPSKILNFSQDFYDKASYINSLEEENDIKTGLIVSKNLHSLLLANWANEFAKIYIDKYISNISVEIEYSNTEPTNKEVTATLKTDAAITVTNNQNSKTYKFTENGEFTFEYTIRGQAFTKKATVTNIDKTPPVITGVENEGFYTGSVTPKVTDTNLKEVKLYNNSNLVQNYASNSPIAEDGNYKIVATDKAGNETTVTFYICKIPATISYSETNLTNQNVTATINSNYDLQVTNNSGKKTYTFTNNGTFTFNYKIKGKAFTVTATVNNIDKKAPVITGVEEGKLYIDQAVIPKVTDENLKEVNLYLNSVQVSNFSSGTQVTKEGFYKIVATDKAGNQTTINFSLMKNNSKEYKVKGKYIINITSNTKKTDFVKNFNNTSQYQVTRNGKALTNNDIIATGDILKSNNGDEYTLIVTGDINKDGDVDIVDIVKLRRYLLLRNNLDEAALLAADCNLDGESLSVTDLVKLRLIVLYKGAT